MNEELNKIIKKRFGNNGELDGKTLFLIKMALVAAINSAVRRNSYNYQPSFSEDHFKWKKLLIKHSISIPTSIDLFVEDVGKLKKELKKAFGKDSTIRLSHAQKSLSVFLKYLWCFGLIDMPPACPIDRNVLGLVKNSPVSNWTQLDNLNDYRIILNALNDISQPEKMAFKELVEWNR